MAQRMQAIPGWLGPEEGHNADHWTFSGCTGASDIMIITATKGVTA